MKNDDDDDAISNLFQLYRRSAKKYLPFSSWYDIVKWYEDLLSQNKMHMS